MIYATVDLDIWENYICIHIILWKIWCQSVYYKFTLFSLHNHANTILLAFEIIRWARNLFSFFFPSKWHIIKQKFLAEEENDWWKGNRQRKTKSRAQKQANTHKWKNKTQHVVGKIDVKMKKEHNYSFYI